MSNNTYFKRREFSYHIDQNVIDLIQELQEKKSYQRWGLEKLSKKFNYNIPTVKSALSCLTQKDDSTVEKIILSGDDDISNPPIEAQNESETASDVSGCERWDYQTGSTYESEYQQFLKRNKINENDDRVHLQLNTIS